MRKQWHLPVATAFMTATLGLSGVVFAQADNDAGSLGSVRSDATSHVGSAPSTNGDTGADTGTGITGSGTTANGANTSRLPEPTSSDYGAQNFKGPDDAQMARSLQSHERTSSSTGGLNETGDTTSNSDDGLTNRTGIHQNTPSAGTPDPNAINPSLQTTPDTDNTPTSTDDTDTPTLNGD